MTTSSARRREVATVASEGATVAAGVRVATEHRSGPSDAIGVVVDCVENITVSREFIGC